MTRLEKIKYVIKQGTTYDKLTGKFFRKDGVEITTKNDAGYIMLSAGKHNGTSYLLRGHQFAWYLETNKTVEVLDHINGIRDDNRIINLRETTALGNSRNRVNAKGYSFDKSRNKWKAEIRIKPGVKKQLGRFNTEDEARQAYLNAKEIYH